MVDPSGNPKRPSWQGYVKLLSTGMKGKAATDPKTSPLNRRRTSLKKARTVQAKCCVPECERVGDGKSKAAGPRAVMWTSTHCLTSTDLFDVKPLC